MFGAHVIAMARYPCCARAQREATDDARAFSLSHEFLNSIFARFARE